MITKEKRNIAVFYSNTNVIKNDAVGAFIPEARAFQIVHGIPHNNMCGINCKNVKTSKRRQVLMEHLYALGRNEPLDGIAFFCHGWPQGIQFGFTKHNLMQLANLINGVTRDYLEIVIYSCYCAENNIKDNNVKNIGPATKGGFADTLACELGKFGVSGHVDAHKTRGHTTVNPNVIRFSFSVTEPRAYWLVEPGSESWPAWVRAIKGSNLRFEYPFMTELQIKNQLVDMVVK